MVDLSRLNAFANVQKKAFQQEKAFIKKALTGQQSMCTTCQQPLMLVASTKGDQLTLNCPQGCTDIMLDIE